MLAFGFCSNIETHHHLSLPYRVETGALESAAIPLLNPTGKSSHEESIQ